MVAGGYVKVGDTIQFQFKTHVFTCVISSNGILAHCTWNDKPAFSDRGGFLTLTDWADTCIQECAAEYVTRFSSWRRVKHVATGKPMYVLRDDMWKSKHEHEAPTIETLSADLVASQRRIIQLESQLNEARSKRAPLDVPIDRSNPFLTF